MERPLKSLLKTLHIVKHLKYGSISGYKNDIRFTALFIDLLYFGPTMAYKVKKMPKENLREFLLDLL